MGPPLVLIPGGNGDACCFAAVAPHLTAHHTVVSYDRRGFSRSTVETSPGDHSRRIDADVDDAVRLIEHLGGEPADVLGASSGAIVALELLARRPERVRTLIAHEPPLVTLLPDAADHLAGYQAIHDAYRREGVRPAALARYAAGIIDAAPSPDSDTIMARMRHNMAFWIEHELLTYPRLTPDVPALATQTSRLVLAAGQESRDSASPPYRSTAALAEHLRLPVAPVPGGHIGYLTHAEDFAHRLIDILAAGEPPAP